MTTKQKQAHLRKAIQFLQKDWGTCKELLPGCYGCDATLTQFYIERMIELYEEIED